MLKRILVLGVAHRDVVLMLQSACSVSMQVFGWDWEGVALNTAQHKRKHTPSPSRHFNSIRSFKESWGKCWKNVFRKITFPMNTSVCGLPPFRTDMFNGQMNIVRYHLVFNLFCANIQSRDRHVYTWESYILCQ